MVRHAECTKNVDEKFGGSGESEMLTTEGTAAADALGLALSELAAAHGQFELGIADSFRARLTAERIKRFCQPARTSHLPLTSIRMGSADGLTELELRARFPDTYADLEMYRAGLLNSYEMRLPPDAENQRAFEIRTVSVCRSAVESASTDWMVMVLHRSPITTMCIQSRRSVRAYPEDFFGHVVVDLACAYVLSYEHKAFRIVNVNVGPHELRRAVSFD